MDYGKAEFGIMEFLRQLGRNIHKINSFGT